MNDIAIRVEHLSKLYRLGARSGGYRTFRETVTDWFKPRPAAPASDPQSFWALKDISFEVRRGEVMGVIGRNGAGKSTFLKVLSRITEPTAGWAEIHGRVGSLLEVGTGFHPELSGRENVWLNGAILGMHRAEVEAKFDEIVAFSEVEKFIDTPVKHYSSGMYLRLAFAVAAHLEPEILLVDEVLAVGDSQFQKKCLGKMSEVAKGGRTVLFVSHDMTAIIQLSDRALLLDGGKVGMLGPTEDVVSAYLKQAGQQHRSLAQRRDRQGDGTARLEAVDFCDLDGKLVPSIRAGGPLVVRVSIQSALTDLHPEELWLDVTFRDPLGRPVTCVSTRFSPPPARAGVDPRSFSLSCTIPRLLVAEDSYAVDLWLAYRSGLCDYVQRAAEVQVSAGDFFGTGHAPVPRKHGPMLTPHSWSLTDFVGDDHVRS